MFESMTINNKSKKTILSFVTAVFFCAMIILSVPTVLANDEDQRLLELLRIVEKNPQEDYALERIYMKDDILYCTGSGRAARENNRAASYMEKGDYLSASKILEEALKERSLFFPFRYNLGSCYVHLRDLKKAMLNFHKAQLTVPEFSHTYLQMGYIYQRWNQDYEAVENFREALKRNTGELETFVLIGNVFFKRNQLEMARKYYDAVLKKDHLYPNGLLGRAKIYFKRGRYIKTLVMLKSINTARDYDKALHYYFAESSFKLRDYKTAAREYEKLLSFPNDRFFLTNSPALIRHKLEISRRISLRK